jgi:hypothetical protein
MQRLLGVIIVCFVIVNMRRSCGGNGNLIHFHIRFGTADGLFREVHNRQMERGSQRRSSQRSSGDRGFKFILLL